MRIQIPLYIPEADDYKTIKSSLKQLELSVHHAQKAVESAEKEGVELEEGGLTYMGIKDVSTGEDSILTEKPTLEIFLDEGKE